MQKILDFESSREHYTADACVVWCFDARFTKALQSFAQARNYKHYDLVRIAGGAKSLASPDNESERIFVLKQIEISLKLHRAEKIVLMSHSDCGAYGGIKSFENDTDREKETHIQELTTAKEFLEQNLSASVPVELIFVDFDSIWEV